MFLMFEFSKDIIISDGRINLSQNVLMFVEYLIWFVISRLQAFPLICITLTSVSVSLQVVTSPGNLRPSYSIITHCPTFRVNGWVELVALAGGTQKM